MRVGFIRQLLWERYGEVWLALVKGLELDPQFATLERVRQTFRNERITISGLSFRLAAAEALALVEADVLLAPDLNPSEAVARGSGQDPWIASFPEALRGIGGLPPIVKVPAKLGLDLETLVLETLMAFKRDPGRLRLAWERNQSNLKPKRYIEPRWTKLPHQKEVVAVIGQAWLLTTNILALLNARNNESYLISQNRLNTTLIKEEAKRLGKRLVATDAEVLGAAHYLNRKGNVDKLLMIVDQTSGSDVWLETQVKKIVTKALDVLYLQDLITEDNIVETLLVQH